MTVTTAGCMASPWSAAAWGELLRVELAADGVAVAVLEHASDTAPHVDVAPASCDAAATTATLTCSAGGDPRRLDLADVAAVARPRVVAIEVADFVRACVQLSERAGPARPSPEPPDPTPRPVEAAAPAQRAPIIVGVLGEGRAYAADATVLGGGRGFIDVPILTRWVARADAGALYGTASDSLGTIAGTIASLGASLRATTATRGFVLGAGMRGELGDGWFRGRAGAPSVTATRASSSLAYAAATATAATRLTDTLGAELDLDAGATVRGFTADADAHPLFGALGLVVALRLGLTWSPQRR
jgi:hypothetical protein